MTTYTIVYIEGMLLATVPDGEDIAAAVLAYEETSGLGPEERPIEGWKTEEGLTLANDRPDDSDRIVWDASSGSGGFLMIETGQGTQTYKYAIR